MWRAERSKGEAVWTLFLVLGAHRVYWAVRRGSDIHESGDLPMDLSIGGESQSLRSVEGALGAVQMQLEKVLPPAQSGQVRVMVSERWIPVTGMRWDARLGNRAVAPAVARMNLQAGGFQLADEDTIRMDDVPEGVPRLVAAYPQSLLALLRRFAAHWQAQLISVLPLAVASWYVFRKNRELQALLLSENGVLLMIRSDGSPFPSELTFRLAAADAAVDLHGFWHRLVLRQPSMEQVRPVHVMQLGAVGVPARGLGAPFEPVAPNGPWSNKLAAALHVAVQAESLHHALDAVSPEKTVSGAIRWLGLVLLVLTAASLFHFWSVHEEWRLLQARSAAARANSERIERVEAVSKADRQRIPAVNAAIRELNMPFWDLLRALTAENGIHVTVLSVQVAVDGADERTKIQIVGEAKSSTDMTRYVASVAKNRRFPAAHLIRHEVMEALPGQPLRFTVEAQWLP